MHYEFSELQRKMFKAWMANSVHISTYQPLYIHPMYNCNISYISVTIITDLKIHKVKVVLLDNKHEDDHEHCHDEYPSHFTSPIPLPFR